MLYTKLIMLVNLLAFSFIVSQSFLYIIALVNVQRSMDAPSYIQLRKLLDRNFRAKFSIAIYTSLVTSFALCIVTASDPGSVLFISSIIAFISLVIDVILTMKGNMPINNRINTWTTTMYPDNWQLYREKWLRIFRFRQLVSIIGFISLLLGALFGN